MACEVMSTQTINVGRAGRVKRTRAVFGSVIGKKQDVALYYNNFVWALAERFTDSPEEMEVAADEIFHDMRRYAAGESSPNLPEARLVAKIAWRRLLGYLQ